MPEPGNIDVVVLSAGQGLRLRPITENIPKALVPLNQVPLLNYHLRALQSVGVRRVICVVGYLREKIAEFAGDGHRYGLEIQYVHQERPLGTGDAVLAAAPSIHSDVFGVIYSDTYFTQLAQLWDELISTPDAKIVCAQVPDASAYGRIVLQSGTDSPILHRVIEKDGNHSSGLVNTGMYLLPRTILSILPSLAPSARGERELPSAVELLSSQGTSVTVITTSGWVDIGSRENLILAQRLVKGASPQ